MSRTGKRVANPYTASEKNVEVACSIAISQAREWYRRRGKDFHDPVCYEESAVAAVLRCRDRYREDNAYGASFLTYAQHFITGALREQERTYLRKPPDYSLEEKEEFLRCRISSDETGLSESRGTVFGMYWDFVQIGQDDGGFAEAEQCESFRAMLRAASACLGEIAYYVIELRYGHGLTKVDVAAVLGMTIYLVCKIEREALLILKEHLVEWNPDSDSLK